MKKHFKHTVTAVLAAAMALACLTGYAQQLEDPLRIVVGYPPGGSSDRAARLVGEALKAKYGITVIVENKAGAGGRLAAQQLKTATAKDNVLMLGNPAVMTVAPLVFKDNRYDPDVDFVPVSMVTSYEFGVAVGPQVPVQEVQQLVDWVKANPEKALFGVPATGSLPHFFALMLGERASVKAEVVGYKGSSPLVVDLIGGQIPVAIDTLDTLIQQRDRLKILAQSGSSRADIAKDIPTLKESGFDLVALGWNGFFAPKAMPSQKVQALAEAIQTVSADVALKKQFSDNNMELVSMSREQTVQMLKDYKAQWEPVVKRSGYEQ